MPASFELGAACSAAAEAFMRRRRIHRYTEITFACLRSVCTGCRCFGTKGSAVSSSATVVSNNCVRAKKGEYLQSYYITVGNAEVSHGVRSRMFFLR